MGAKIVASSAFDHQLIVIDNNESATEVAHLLMNTLNELQNNVSTGKESYHLLQQLKDIVFCIYYSAESEYTALLHNIVSYALVQIFKYEN